MKKSVILVASFLWIRPLFACTIFILTDANNALFFNNEDYTNPNTKMWFIPAGKDYYGCVFVGYDDGSAQGGLNTEGVAFDWYAGDPVRYVPEEHLIPIDDNSSERMLEQCSSVAEAIKFYQTYAEPGFAKASIIIADKSGESVIIGARNGKIFFERSRKPNVLGGAGKAIFESLFNEKTPISLASGSRILEQCVATGRGGTLYSNAYDLKTGDIHVYDFSEENKYVTLNLYEELEKGAHYYELPRLKSGTVAAIEPLLLNMKRLILFEFEPVSNEESSISNTVEEFFIDAARGNLKKHYLSTALWAALNQDAEGLKEEIRSLGKLKSVHLVQKEKHNDTLQYTYVLIFDKIRLLQQFDISAPGKIVKLKTLSSFAHPEFFGSGENPAGSQNKAYPISRYVIIGLAAIFSGGLIYVIYRRTARQ